MAATDTVFKITPPPCRRIAGTACFAARKIAFAFTSIRRSNCASVVSLDRRRRLRQAGIVDDDVDAAEAIHGGLHHAPRVLVLRDVGGDERPPPISCATARPPRAVDDHDLRAFGDEPAADRGAEAGSAASDDRDLVVQTQGACSRFRRRTR